MARVAVVLGLPAILIIPGVGAVALTFVLSLDCFATPATPPKEPDGVAVGGEEFDDWFEVE